LGAKAGEDRAAIQSIPVPITMWKPWAEDGAVADLLGRGNTIEVSGLRVGVAICYEQLLSFSLLRIMLDTPTVLAAVSNVWWASASTIPIIQQQTVNAFGRLFGVPVISARNI
jgi:predicted amidohydrolase